MKVILYQIPHKSNEIIFLLCDIFISPFVIIFRKAFQTKGG